MGCGDWGGVCGGGGAQWNKKRKKVAKSEEGTEEKMAEAVDNIFEFKNKNR